MRDLLLLCLALNFVVYHSQGQEYFQQRVDYNITAQLDTSSKMLDANVTWTYYNNSPDTLQEIYVHVWMNAFKNRNTSFAKQKIEIGDADFHFAKEESRGSYTRLNISMNGDPVEFFNYMEGMYKYEDILVLKLKQPIAPRTVERIEFDYSLKIPEIFSRAGYSNQLFQMTQWYPKPAVYDTKGWHPMPYLSIGEFYSEYGNYKVKLDVPISYSIASTGEEIESESKLDLANRRRIVTIEAHQVHDFAWFASESYIPYRESVEIGDRIVSINLLVKEDNNNFETLFTIAKRAMVFLSNKLIDYPYPQFTIVEADQYFDSGMEYPMITLVGLGKDERRNEHLVVHEMAHQWFYSVLGSNERDEPWIDEGFTSYLDKEYERQFHDDLWYNKTEGAERVIALGEKIDWLDAMARTYERSHYGTSVLRSSHEGDLINYFNNNYAKASGGIKYLEEYMGVEWFDKALKRLFNHWSHKHPDGHNVQEVFESTISKDLNWFFDGYLNNESRIDLKIDKATEDEIHISRNSLLDMPVHLTVNQKNGLMAFSSWYESNQEEEQILNIPGGDFGSFVINDGLEIYDIKPQNNHYFKRKKLLPGFRFFNLSESESKKKIGLLPHLFVNSSDGLMLGGTWYSASVPLPELRYTISPSYAFGTGILAGVANIEKDLFFDKGLRHLRKATIGMHARRFSYYESEMPLDYSLAYTKLKPSFTLHFAKDIFNFSSLSYQFNWIRQELPEFEGTNVDIYNQNYFIHKLEYNKTKINGLGRSDINIEAQYEDYKQPFNTNAHYLRTMLTLKRQIKYNRNNALFLRLHTAYFPINSQRNSSSYASVFTRGSVALAGQAYTDQGFDHYYFDRKDPLSSQIVEEHSGFKTALGSAQAIGLTNDFSFALNAKVDLPIGFLGAFKIRPYFDFAVVRTKSLTSNPLMTKSFYSGGVALEVSEYIGLYLPLINSETIDQAYESNSPFGRMSFKLNLSAFNIWRVIDHPGLLWE